jgi:hypothetical protein
LLLALLRLSLRLGLSSLLSSLLLGLGFGHGLLLLPNFLHEFWDGHAVLLRIDSELSLHRGDLLWSWLLSWWEKILAGGALRRVLTCHCDMDWESEWNGEKKLWVGRLAFGLVEAKETVSIARILQPLGVAVLLWGCASVI